MLVSLCQNLVNFDDFTVWAPFVFLNWFTSNAYHRTIHINFTFPACLLAPCACVVEDVGVANRKNLIAFLSSGVDESRIEVGLGGFLQLQYPCKIIFRLVRLRAISVNLFLLSVEDLIMIQFDNHICLVAVDGQVVDSLAYVPIPRRRLHSSTIDPGYSFPFNHGDVIT